MMDRRNILLGLGTLVTAPAIVPIHNLMKVPRRRLYIPKTGEMFVEVMHEGATIYRGPCTIKYPKLNAFDFDSDCQPFLQRGYTFADGYLNGISLAEAEQHHWHRFDFDQPVLARKGDAVTIKVDRA